MLKHLFGRKAPRILSAGIQFADDDHLQEQEHEKIDEGGGGGGTETKTGEQKSAEFEARKADFFSRYSASNKAPPELGGETSNEPNQNRIEQAKKDAERQTEQERQQKEAGQKKREGGNVKHILEQKRTAEAERDELKKKTEEFETKVKPELDKKIADLEARIAGGVSPAKEKELSDKIVQLEKEKQDREETLVNENKQLKDKLRFYDLQNDETFYAEFVQPVVNAHAEAVKALGGNKAKYEAFQRALIANAASLRTSDPEEKQRAISERNTIMSGIVAEMDEFAADAFKRAAFEYINRTEKHAIALQEHEKTTVQIREKARKQAEVGQAQMLESWNTAYRNTAETYKEEETLAEDDAKLAKELGFDAKAELEKASVTAKKVVTGQSTMMEAIDMVHRGRLYPVQRARIAVLEKKLSERDELIAKLRKSGPSGGESNGSSQQQKKPEAKTREEFHKRYSANRPGLRTS